jgi:hypothetical protein
MTFPNAGGRRAQRELTGLNAWPRPADNWSMRAAVGAVLTIPLFFLLLVTSPFVGLRPPLLKLNLMAMVGLGLWGIVRASGAKEGRGVILLLSLSAVVVGLVLALIAYTLTHFTLE